MAVLRQRLVSRTLYLLVVTIFSIVILAIVVDKWIFHLLKGSKAIASTEKVVRYYEKCLDANEKGDTSCALAEYHLLKNVHEARYPALVAGLWIEKPVSELMSYTPEHLKCLDREIQGNCHDPNKWKNGTNATRSRHASLLKHGVQNSPGILLGQDPFVWISNLSAYSVFPYDYRTYAHRVKQLLLNRSMYLVGDSLTRQWVRVLRCEGIHVFNMTEEESIKAFYYIADHPASMLDQKTRTYASAVEKFRKNATGRDYVILNYGHHLGRSKLGQKEWRKRYENVLRNLQDFPFGQIPDHHVFFRTTSVRHFLYNRGDWNTNSSQAGDTLPNMNASWSNFGGNKPEQPDQNLLVFDFLKGPNKRYNFTRKRDFQILDVSPMMLARADASFDGSHFCIPGPHQFWSQMLYQRIAQQEEEAHQQFITTSNGQ